jgi:4-oxalocrotonate tautomerase
MHGVVCRNCMGTDRTIPSRRQGDSRLPVEPGRRPCNRASSPLIKIYLMEGRPLELLHRLLREMSALVAEILQIPIDQTRVLLTEIPVTHWGIGGVPASEARAAEIAARAAQTT